MLVPVALIGLITGLVSLESAQVLSGVVEDKFSCPHGWTRYGAKKCLKYVNELQDYERAQATCRSKNQGTLVTVHSHDEQNFVYSYIHSISASSTPIWLGAKQIDFESILWLDKTENSYTNWAPSEPSHPDEICIAINPRNGQWHDVMCTEANVPACERAPTTQWPFFVAFCAEGWFQFNDEKCVRIISSQALNFYESQELCRSKYNSKLLSIKSDKESEFVHNLIKFRDVKLPVWLGAVQNDFSSFNWIDKSDVTFTNWAEGEPNDPDHACISMVASGGKWSDNDCKEQKLILCQKVPEEGSCETGWLQFRQDKCYRFVHIRLAFDDAETLCNNLYAGHLPSIHSSEEQFMISQFLSSVNVKNGSEIWLGGRQMDFHNFNWGDGSLFNYSYWDQGEPSFPAEKCIEMSWRNGRWNDINCRLKRAVLCERQVTSRHQIKPILYQPTTCLDSNNCTGALGGGGGGGGGGGSMTTLQGIGHATIGGNNQSGGGDLTISAQASQAAADPAYSHSPQHHNNNQQQQQQLNQQDQRTLLTNSNGTFNGTSGSPSLLLSASSSSSSSSDDQLPARASGNSMIAPEDRPIKVIASIMNREQQQKAATPADQLKLSMTTASTTATNGSQSILSPQQPALLEPLNGTFIHYNLPPPEQMFAENNNNNNNNHDTQSASSEPVIQSSSNLTLSARNDNYKISQSSGDSPLVIEQQQQQQQFHKVASTVATSQESANQALPAALAQPDDQQQQQTTVSLLDKIKQQATDSQAVATTNTTITTSAPNLSTSAYNTNTTALGVPPSLSVSEKQI